MGTVSDLNKLLAPMVVFATSQSIFNQIWWGLLQSLSPFNEELVRVGCRNGEAFGLSADCLTSCEGCDARHKENQQSLDGCQK